MAEAVLFEAIRKTAVKKHLASTALLAALDACEQAGTATTAEQLYQWLASPSVPDRRAGRKLAQALVPPDRVPFGPYRPLTHLADGGMGSVWLAASPEGRLVVVKTLRKEFGQSADMAYRFQREARITQQLEHPAAVLALDAGQADDGTLYMVLEYVDAGDLQDLVEAVGPLSEAQALSVLHQMAQVLDRAHGLHLVHRDIKPANIFVAADGSAKLADFGIARSTESTRTMLTMEGAIVGSPLYMSPEQVLGASDLDIRCDLYALGAVLYYCLAGEPPYLGERVQDIMHMHCSAPIPDIARMHPVISKWTPPIIARCMAKDRGDRYRDPRALQKDCAKALKKLGLKAHEPVALPVAASMQLEAEPAAPDMVDGTVDTDAVTVAEDPDATVPGIHFGETEVAPAPATLEETAFPDVDPGETVTATVQAHGDAFSHDAPTVSDAAADATLVATGAATQATSIAPGMSEDVLAAAYAGDWLCLRSPRAGDPTCVLLYARSQLTMGKLCDAPVDIGLRYYPVQVHKPAVMRVSRQHCRLFWDAGSKAFLVEDLGSANGSLLNGRTLEQDQPKPVEQGREHLLLLGGVISLTLTALPARGARPQQVAGLPPETQAQLGLDANLAADALLITRPDNRQEMTYVMLLRRVSIGGPRADVPVPEAGGGPDLELIRWCGHWFTRGGEQSPWQPLQLGTQVACGGRMLRVEAGSYEHMALDS